MADVDVVSGSRPLNCADDGAALTTPRGEGSGTLMNALVFS